VTGRINRDFGFGLAMLVTSAGYYLAATAIPESQLADAVGPRGLPTAYALLLAALSLILMIRSRGPGGGSAKRGERYPLWRVAGMLAIGAVYIAVVPWLGYLLSLAGLIFATIYYQGGTVNRQVAIVAVAGAVFCWVLFVVVMRIPQPPGLWPSLL
jgi:putative tricarboxylic transport membrane protein